MRVFSEKMEPGCDITLKSPVFFGRTGMVSRHDVRERLALTEERKMQPMSKFKQPTAKRKNAETIANMSE
jgi:hypothetical protein